MKKIRLIASILGLLIIPGHLLAQNFVTYEFSGGRFGDCLLSYLHAKWIAYHYNMDLLYKPFEYSSELVLHDEEKEYSNFNNRLSFKISSLLTNPDLNFKDVVFSCPYFPEIKWELDRGTEGYGPIYFPVNWKDKGYRTLARQMIAPKNPLPLIQPPEDAINIAIHVREGGGFDDKEHFFKHPLKTPPFTYYAECLNRVIALFPQRQLHCHLFTDAVDPQELVNFMKSKIPPSTSIEFECRDSGNRHNANVLLDFFSFFNFDIMIRPESNYSIIPSLIGDFAIVYIPETFKIYNNPEDRFVVIDQIKTEVDEERCAALLDNPRYFRYSTQASGS